MAKEDSRTLKRFAAELSVIVLGVFLALAADAAWTSRDDLQREAAFLRDLREEFRDHEARILGDIESNRRAEAAALAFADAIRGRSSVPDDSLRALMSGMAGGARFDPSNGALRSLIDGGDLGLIRSSDLRRALAGWPDRVEEQRQTRISTANERYTLLPIVTGFQPRQVLSTGEEFLLDQLALIPRIGYDQQERLLEDILQIAELIDAELGRQ